MMSAFIRRKVSQNRFRLENGRYDLDLTYICDNIIAMGLPADTLIQSVARNPLDTVARYLREKHHERFKIYNLLRKPKYNYSQFDNMVESFPMRDHNPPVFTLIETFCRSVHEWLTKDNRNVIVVHCKAGKGRTGTMISCYFLYSERFKDPFEAMDYFSQRRCLDGKGVTIPSQRRYVEYFADYLHNKRTYKESDLYLKQIDFSMPNNSYFNTLSFRILKDNLIKLYDSDEKKLSLKNEICNMELRFPVRVNGDIKIMFFNKSFGNKNCIFTITFNTFFLFHDISTQINENSCLGKVIMVNDSIIWTLNKAHIDIACKDKRFSSDMKLIFHFDQNPSNSNLNPAKGDSKEEPVPNNAIENLHFTDDNGLFHQTTKKHEDIRKTSSTNSFHLNGNSKPNLSRSDSYVTPNPVIFDIQENEEASAVINGGQHLTEANKEKNNLIDRFNVKSKTEESRKVLLTEQSRTSSESNESDTSSEHEPVIIKQNVASQLQQQKPETETKIFESKNHILEKGDTEAPNQHLKDSSNKIGFSFFKKKNFFSLKKKPSSSKYKKYERQHSNNSNKNNNNNHNNNPNDTHDENSQSYDLLSNSSNHKISSLSNSHLNDDEVNNHHHEISNISDNRNENYANFSNEDDYDDDNENIGFKPEKNNFKKFFSRKKSNN